MARLSQRFALFVERHPALYKGFLLLENLVKKPTLRCRSCGQCVLSYNAFTCCMRCPKQMRNGPCGGTRPDGTCEVYPDRPCIWHLIYTRSVKLGREKKLLKHHRPIDHRLVGTSAILNAMAGRTESISLRRDLAGGEERPANQPSADTKSRAPSP